MAADELLFWNGYPNMLPVYEVLRERLTARYPEMTIRVSKTQISL